MMKEEFEQRIGTTVTESDYRIIEKEFADEQEKDKGVSE